STWGNWLGLCSATAKSVPLASRRHEFLTQNALLGQGRAARMSGPTPQARLRVSKQAPPHVWRPTPAGRRWGGPCEARRGCSWCGAADTRGGHDGHSLSGPTAGANWHVKIGGKKASMQEDGKRGQGKAEQKQMRDGPLGASSRCRKPRKGRQRPSETTTKCRVCGDQRDKILLAVSSLPSVQDDHTTRTAHITKAILIAEAPSLYGLAQCAMPWQLWHCERPAGSTQLSKVHAP
ncbi:unnamed protein product, partial [Prorocentrum cordatum]